MTKWRIYAEVKKEIKKEGKAINVGKGEIKKKKNKSDGMNKEGTNAKRNEDIFIWSSKYLPPALMSTLWLNDSQSRNLISSCVH